MSVVVTLGETMALQLAAPGTTLDEARSFTASIAGAESNVAIALSRLGVPARWISRVGNDDRGAAITGILEAEGVDTTFVTVDPSAPTGLLVRDCCEPPTVRYERTGSAASRMSEADLAAGWLAGANVLHVTGITPALSDMCWALVERAMHAARQLGVLITFDPNIRPSLWPQPDAATAVLRRMTALADVVLPGTSELPWLDDAASPCDAAGRLLELGPRLVVVKTGTGAFARAADVMVQVPDSPVANVVDPVGAGDAFAAGVIAGLLRVADPRSPSPDELRRVVRCGCAMGARAVTFAGDWEGLPTGGEFLDAVDD